MIDDFETGEFQHSSLLNMKYEQLREHSRALVPPKTPESNITKNVIML